MKEKGSGLAPSSSDEDVESCAHIAHYST